ncbi:restriction endonuclease subunit S [Leptospira sp. 2 VSF19]|uniref:Restriction endonuclease subunit S n=1 Tax=Leptospira soteropolitanensis TaxID=2950025 RepID=A0AAW5VJN2_9LEPT|nr:restriction endonuclease subunit S [Leptospira soteropolitanensis]MCW7494650.1 restriction endonuclease subunit S [Leptospira soteropolitanensis]MCW7499988.1 restriction endonuclease subunit S [Leptospira soteropolitanensis]MCW7522239.1 restriction endonuclease subunit S [Leptospira soteropolitanensis]MCW7526095.1 restriction endonuclease subunit S [Leptospira soteropolitanensis]MCW7529793.1 restriction endonuclease subunit S [Leptospira soteropolitanensis]
MKQKDKNSIQFKFKPYPKYKDSRIEWIGEIPTEWKTLKIRHACEYIKSGTTPESSSEEFYGGSILWVTTGELRESFIEDTAKKVNEKALRTYSALSFHPKGSVLIAMYGATIGRLGMLNKEAVSNQACLALFSKTKLFNRYLFYWLYATRDELIRISSGGGQPNVNQEKLASLRVSTPPLDEQKAIATFLDRETKKIDNLIAKQELLIALLEEKRQALISHAVTKGLDPKAKMKDSGVEWLGEIPEGWEVVSLRLKIKIASGDGISNHLVEAQKSETHSIPSIGGNGIMGYTLSPNTLKNAFAIGRVGALCGNVHFINYPAWITDNALKISKWNDFENLYFFYLIYSAKLNRLASTSAQPLITGETVKNLKVPLPAITEQKTIAEYLDAQTKKIDLLKEKAFSVIELLNEKRSALISSAVTGKIDVRELV